MGTRVFCQQEPAEEEDSFGIGKAYHAEPIIQSDRAISYSCFKSLERINRERSCRLLNAKGKGGKILQDNIFRKKCFEQNKRYETII